MIDTGLDEPVFSLDEFIEVILAAHRLGISLDKRTREEVIASIKEILILHFQEYKQ